MNSNPPRKQEKIRIMMVDDHPIVREGMAQLLNAEKDLDLCCEAGTSEEALAKLATCNPCLIIVDILLNKDSGLTLIKTLRHRTPKVALLVLSLHDESIYAERALRAGANGYLMKDEATRNVLLAVRTVLAGEIYLSTAMHKRIAERLAQPVICTTSHIAGVTDREFEILHLLGLGFGTRQISEKLNRSIKTIETHRAKLKEKLNLKTSVELVRFATLWLEDESPLY